mmetsp:Transcript_21277/g.67342  ORF Transcript_21277/g.67342 Transcript_21277/m.67342 type:complete len:314 (+) Transcript_21277:2-943(+)
MASLSLMIGAAAPVSTPVVARAQSRTLGSAGGELVRVTMGSSYLRGSTAALHVSSSRPAVAAGALNVQMNLFNRMGRVMKSYANAAISAAEDPEKILEQTVTEMQDDLIKMRQASAQVMASQKQLENKYKQAQATADDWYKRAQLALNKGDEDLAREALVRKKSYQEQADSLKSQVDAQTEAVEKLISNTRLLESKMAEAKSKKDTLKARAQSAKTQQKVNDMVSGISTSSALSAFDRMEEKVMQLEAEADAAGVLSAGDKLEAEFKLLESGGGVDDELAAMKGKMLGGGAEKKGELPAGRPIKVTLTLHPKP